MNTAKLKSKSIDLEGNKSAIRCSGPEVTYIRS